MAGAESLINDDYTDVPTVMTQDSVAAFFANQGCQAETLQPDEASVALLHRVYQFVWEGKNRPVRYFIVVLGIPQGGGEYVWYPYRGRVETLGEIKWDIPADDWAALSRQPISFHVLTDRIGPRGGKIWGMEEYYERGIPAFSKDAGDVRKVRYWYSEWGEKIDDKFRVWLVDLTGSMEAEVQRIGAHVAAGKPILDYFPQERKAEALLMLPADVAPADLVVYDIIAMMDEEYKDTYGDVNVEVIFSTAYDPRKAMIVLAGFVNEDDSMAPFVEWYVLRTKALDAQPDKNQSDAVEIGLKQLFLPWMEEKPLMLVVMSEMLETR